MGSDRDDAMHLLDHDTCRPIFADRRARRFSSFDNDSCQHRAPRSGSYLFRRKRSRRCPKARCHRSQANKRSDPMSADANKQIVIDMWNSFSSRDAARIEPFFSDDAVWIAPQDNATAKFLGERSGMIGRAQIVHFILEQFPKVFSRDVNLDFKGVYSDDETVVVEVVLSATVSNGRPYKNDYCYIHLL